MIFKKLVERFQRRPVRFKPIRPGIAAEDLVGRTLRARLKVEEFNGRANNKVEAWLAPLSGSGNAPVPAPLAAPAPASPAAAPTTSTNPAQEDASNEPF